MDATAAHPIRLLLADDDPVMLSTLATWLGPFFSIVGAARNADEAIDLCETCEPDAVIVDARMTQDGGVRAARGIRDRAPRTAIIAFSLDEADSLSAVLAAGAMTYLRGSGTQEHAVRRVHQAVAVHRLAR